MLGFLVLKKQYEKFQQEKKEGFSLTGAFAGLAFYFIINLVLFIFALYLSFKCNNGLNLIDFLLAFFFTPCYLIYRLFAGCNN